MFDDRKYAGWIAGANSAVVKEYWETLEKTGQVGPRLQAAYEQACKELKEYREMEERYAAWDDKSIWKWGR